MLKKSILSTIKNSSSQQIQASKGLATLISSHFSLNLKEIVGPNQVRSFMLEF